MPLLFVLEYNVISRVCDLRCYLLGVVRNWIKNEKMENEYDSFGYNESCAY